MASKSKKESFQEALSNPEKLPGKIHGKIRDLLLKVRERVTKLLAWPLYAFERLCFWLGFTVLLFNLGLGFFLYSVFHSLPDLDRFDFAHLKELAVKDLSTKFEDHNHFKNYKWADINEIHRDCLYTIVMSEDSSFFEHSGINYDSVMNSMSENFRKKKYEYGGSTISQQVVKNLFLSNEKSIVRKLKEFVITERLEKRFSKNQILEVYLNIAEFGPDMYGVRDAAKSFFRKTPSEINAAEGAFMALMLPSPRKNYYAIYQNRNLATAKQRKIHRILGDMLANEFISPKQFRSYLKYRYFTSSNRD